MALNANALLTEAELETMLETLFDTPYAEFLINTASGFIEKYCNRSIKSAVRTGEEYDGNGFKKLYVKNPPITAVSAIHQWDTYNDESLYEYSADTEYLIDEDGQYIYLRGVWSIGVHNYQITYTGGYTTIPDDLKYACAQFCAWINNNKNSMGIKSERIGTYAITYGMATSIVIGGLAVPPEMLSMLSNYRILNV